MTELLYHGTPEARPVQHLVRAGLLSAIFENGSLRTIKLGDQEVARMIYFALRDDQWNTIPTRISDEQLSINDQSFFLTFVCGHYQHDTEVIHWKCELSGDETGTIRFSIDGTVLQPFLRNRAGFCVLHPIIETVGQAVTITHPDSSKSKGVFPELIEPYQPFVDIAAMQWTLPDGAEATLSFEGDIFETEDQRNWSDASFKTYCTPLHLSRPVQLQPGDQIRQVVQLAISPSQSPVSPKRSTASPTQHPVLLPTIGLSHAIDQPKLKADEAAQLRKMGLNYVRIALDFGRPDWSEWLTVGLSEAKRLHVQVVLAVTFTNHYQTELSQLQQAVEWLNPSISAVEVFHTNHPAIDSTMLTAVAAPLKKLFSGARLGVGSAEQFTELNRNRPAPTDSFDYLVYALNPQVHAVDDQTLIENIAAQADTVQTARSFAGDTPIHVGPITLRPRHYTEADHRQPSLLTAGWLVGSLASLTLAGASSLTYFETKGPKGVIEGIDPETNQGQVFPVGLVLMAMADWQGAECITEETYNSLTVSTLSLRKEHAKLLLVANHTWDEPVFSLPDTFPLPAQVWVLDETTAPACMQAGELPTMIPVDARTVSLKPFAIAGILTQS